tara:strand:+ start:282 stop:1034 length:753 start_codon:yes stop_codon:yes gene_type:complete
MKTFNQFQESIAVSIKGGSKLVPALMTGIGAAGTILQSRRAKKARKPYEKKGTTKTSKTSKPSKEDMLKRVRDAQERINSEINPDLNTPTDIGQFTRNKVDKRTRTRMNKPENQFENTAMAIKTGSKVVPALMTGIGAAGMIMQSKKSKGPFAGTGGFDASKSRTKRQYLGLPPSSDLTKQQKKNRKIKGQREIIKKRDDQIAKEGPGDLVPGAKRARLKKLLDRYLEKSGIRRKRDANKEIDRKLKLKE